MFKDIVDYAHKKELEFTLSKEANDKNDELIKENTAYVDENHRYNNFMQGLNGRNTTKRLR